MKYIAFGCNELIYSYDLKINFSISFCYQQLIINDLEHNYFIKSEYLQYINVELKFDEVLISLDNYLLLFHYKCKINS